MTEAKQTLAHWRRRALKAEAAYEAMQRIRQTDASMEMQIVGEHSAMRVAIMEIESALEGLKNGRNEG